MRTSVARCGQLAVVVRETTCVLCTTSYNMLNMFWLCMFLAVVILYIAAFVSRQLIICLKKQVLNNLAANNGHLMAPGGESGWNTPQISDERSNW